MTTDRRTPGKVRRAAVWGALLAVGVLGGCGLVKLRDESAAFYSSTVLVGRVDCTPACSGDLIVAAFPAQSGGAAGREPAHRVRLHEPGGYELIVPKGTYTIVAFNDRNGNGVHEAGEAWGTYAGPRPVEASGTGLIALLDFDLREPVEPRGSAAVPQPVQALRAPDVASTQAGAIAPLDTAKFSADNGRRGYWAPVEFFRESGGNIYFLEPYDPQRIPVLFVHGAAGSPQDWRYFFEHLDRTRYQAWFFMYPSGAAVESMAYLMFWKLYNLQLRHRFETVIVTAHSMGGLVARTFFLNHGALIPQARLFVSMSTPWGGEPSAELGVRHSPAVVPSWHDMQPHGAFMNALFARPLPASVEYYLMFGHKGGYSMLRPNNDGTVTLASQLRPSAQAEARRVFGFEEDHDSILRSEAVLRQYAAVLGQQASSGAEPRGSGRVVARFEQETEAGVPRAIPMLRLQPVGKVAASSSSWMQLTEADNGRPVGPVPAGDYDASVVAAGFSATPGSTRIRVDAGTMPEVRVRLRPQGVLSGYVGADGDGAATPAGEYRRPHPDVRIRSITLKGGGVVRTLVPSSSGDGDLSAHYTRSEDAAIGAAFSFVALPEGDYELTLLAEGYQPYTGRYRVVPGRPTPLEPIVLRRGP